MIRQIRLRRKCPECGSTIIVEDGHYSCTQDLLEYEYKFMFEMWELLPEDQLNKKLDAATKTTRELYERWRNPKETFGCYYDPNSTFNPMTQSKVILPDPIQQKIAEFILDRKLNYEEYYGLKKVVLVNEKGLMYKGFIDQLEFPRDYQPTRPRDKDKNKKIDTKPLPIAFTWKTLK